MTTLKSIACLVSATMCLPFVPANAETISLGTVAGWETGAWYDSDKRLGHCYGEAQYKSGIWVYFIIRQDYKWGISLRGGNIYAREGRDYDTLIQIDNLPVLKFTATGIGHNAILIPLGDRPDIFQQMRQGYTLYARFMGMTVQFNLDGTSQMLSAMARCLQTAPDPYPGRNPKSAPAPTPRTSAAPPPSQSSGKKSAQFGSGVFVKSEGTGITNAHVVNGCTSATIEGYGRARITARDKTNDLALVQLTEPKKTEAVQLARRSLKLGEFVYALGFPLPGIIDNGLNFTGGQVSSLSGMGGDTRQFQLSAPVQPGNSGGPVVNTSGQLVGVASARLDDVATLEASGALPQNVNYAIRADIAASFLRANGIDPSESESAAKLDPTDIATAGKGYTFQIKCNPE